MAPHCDDLAGSGIAQVSPEVGVAILSDPELSGFGLIDEPSTELGINRGPREPPITTPGGEPDWGQLCEKFVDAHAWRLGGTEV